MCVFDIHIGDIYSASYDGRHPHKILYHHNWRKRVKYLVCFLNILCHLMILVFSVDGVMGEDTYTSIKQLDDALLTKWDKEYLATCECVRDCLYLNLVFAFIFLVQGT